MKIYFLIIVTLIVLPANVLSNDATITVFKHAQQEQLTPVNRLVFGGFTEFLMDYINGPMGIWSQELVDRGFDDDHCNLEFLCYWNRIGTAESVRRLSGGYNKSGKYYLNLISENNLDFNGISQELLLDTEVDYKFYFYAKGELNNKVKIEFETPEKIIAYTHEFTIQSQEWTKYELDIPKFTDCKHIFKIGLLNEGNVSIDELSLMPNNNLLGVRKEFVELFKEMKMSILRYPGGSFIEYGGNSDWFNKLGHIDQRFSPVYGDLGSFQRMDFGLYEYLVFCEEMNIEPYYVFSYFKADVEDYLKIIEFCNGSADTEYGSLRAEMGHPEPFNVKYFEYGNEIWEERDEYAQNYRRVYIALKEKHPEIRLIAAGLHWLLDDYIAAQIDIIGRHIDNYGWHPTRPILNKDTYPLEISNLLYTTSANYQGKQEVERFYKLIKEKSGNNNVKISFSEWWSQMDTTRGWITDTIIQNHAFDMGLWDANIINYMISFSDIMELGVRTIGLGFIARKYNELIDRKVIFGNPTFKVMSLLSNYIGTHLSEISYTSPKYDLPDTLGIWPDKDLDYLNITSTISPDTLYLHVINNNIYEDYEVLFDIEYERTSNTGKIYSYTTDNYEDRVSKYNPDTIKIVASDWTYNDSHIFPKHSLTTIAIPVKSGISGTDTTKKEDIGIINIYDKFKILNPNNQEILSVEIYDLNGSSLFSKTINSIFDEIILDFNLTGILFFKIQLLDRSIIKKVINLN